MDNMNKGDFSFVVVDDEEHIRKLTVDILQDQFEGSSFFQFPDGLEAKKWLTENPDSSPIVVTDFTMPNLGGEGLVEFIRGSPKLQSTPVIMISGLDSLKAENTARRLGCRFLPKPFLLEEFLGIINEFTK